MSRKLFKYLRCDDWYDSKTPFMLAVFMYFQIFNQQEGDIISFYIRIAAYTLYISMFLAFSYVINDFSDMEIDKMAGKSKVMFEMPKSMIIISLIIIILIGCIPMLFIVSNRVWYGILTIGMYFAGAAYSIHGLRFKERGFWGLLECSIAQKCLPLFPVLLIENVSIIPFAISILVSFVNGLRYILIHQAVDLENDIKTGVRTFVSNGHNQIRHAIKGALCIETVLIIYILFQLINTFTYVAVFIIAYCIFEKIISVVVVKYMNVDWLCTFLAVPLEDLYNVFIPLLMAAILTVLDYHYCIVLIGSIILTFRCFKGKAAFIKVYLQSILKRKIKEKGV